MSGASSGGGAAAGLVAVLSERTLARDVTTEYSKGHPIPWGTVRGLPIGAQGCRGCGVVPPERPSPPRVCSDLSHNALTGSVPSSLSALTNLYSLCVPPLLPPALARAAEEGRVGRLCSEQRGMSGGCMSGASSGGGAAAGLVAVLSEGTLGHAM